MKSIKLTKGFAAFVDDKDYKSLSRFKWQAVLAGKKVYAGRNPGGGGRSKYISMHRLITGCKNGMTVDHIDGDGLNNRRSNLRVCTHQQNSWNSLRVNKLSGFIGVSWHTHNKCWRARFVHRKKEFHLGGFKTAVEAARAYDLSIVKIRGIFAVTNKSSALL